MSKLGIAADHAGYELKELLKTYFTLNGFELIDFGTHSTASCDYPDYIHPLAKQIDGGILEKGIIICGSANGVSMVANKYPGVRAAISWKKEIAELARLHNDANVLALPARYISSEEAIAIVDVFLKTSFEGGRHISRVEKIKK